MIVNEVLENRVKGWDIVDRWVTSQSMMQGERRSAIFRLIAHRKETLYRTLLLLPASVKASANLRLSSTDCGMDLASARRGCWSGSTFLPDQFSGAEVIDVISPVVRVTQILRGEKEPTFLVSKLLKSQRDTFDYFPKDFFLRKKK